VYDTIRFITLLLRRECVHYREHICYRKWWTLHARQRSGWQVCCACAPRLNLLTQPCHAGPARSSASRVAVTRECRVTVTDRECRVFIFKVTGHHSGLRVGPGLDSSLGDCCCCLLLQDLLQSCARGPGVGVGGWGRIVEHMG
jgi:hypothetical protein